MTDEGGEGHTIDVELALQSTEYQTYLNAVCELQKVNLQSYNEVQLLAFFLNVY